MGIEAACLLLQTDKGSRSWGEHCRDWGGAAVVTRVAAMYVGRGNIYVRNKTREKFFFFLLSVSVSADQHQAKSLSGSYLYCTC